MGIISILSEKNTSCSIQILQFFCIVLKAHAAAAKRINKLRTKIICRFMHVGRRIHFDIHFLKVSCCFLWVLCSVFFLVRVRNVAGKVKQSLHLHLRMRMMMMTMIGWGYVQKWFKRIKTKASIYYSYRTNVKWNIRLDRKKNTHTHKTLG